MAIVLGTNSGFVTEAPTEDPAGQTTTTISGQSYVTRDTSSGDATTITEIGWWMNSATNISNFEVGLYAADGATVPGEAGTLLEVERTNSTDTTPGWKRVTVNWSISPDTIYWIGVQVDGSSVVTDLNYTTGNGGDNFASATLPSPFGGGAFFANWMLPFYALYEGAPVGTNMQINISDIWKDIESLKINISDVWKDVIKIQQNIGNVWKTVFE